MPRSQALLLLRDILVDENDLRDEPPGELTLAEVECREANLLKHERRLGGAQHGAPRRVSLESSISYCNPIKRIKI